MQHYSGQRDRNFNAARGHGFPNGRGYCSTFPGGVVLPLVDVAVASNFMTPVPPDPSARFATSLVIMPAPTTNGLINPLRMTLSHHCRPFTLLPVYLLMIAGTRTQVLLTTSLMT